MYQRVGTQLGRFTIRHLLGAGGMAAVYYAIDSTTQQPIALKILSAQLADIMAFRQRFELEAQITTRLQHPHIVPIVAYGQIDDALYIAMRYLSGGTLHDRFVIDGAVSLRETAHYLTQLAAALDYAHTQGIIHRDLKLANVLLDDAQNVLLSDFGIARMLESSLHLTESGSVLGSPHYMSPEQSEGKPLDSRSDIYSLSVMIYLMITGRFPFHADTPVAIALQHVTKQPPAPTEINPELPLDVDTVLLKGLAKAPVDRFSSAGELAAAFERAIGDCDTRTMLHMPDLSRSAPRLPIPPLLPLPVQTPTEPSLPKSDHSANNPAWSPKRHLWRYLLPPVLFFLLLLTFKSGLTQFNTPANSTPPTVTAPKVIILATLTPTAANLQGVTTATRVPEYSVVVKDLYTPANIRGGPGLTFRVVGQLYASDIAQIIARTRTVDNMWYLIRTTQGVTGWVSVSVVDVLPLDALPDNIMVAVTIPPSPTPSNTPAPVTASAAP